MSLQTSTCKLEYKLKYSAYLINKYRAKLLTPANAEAGDYEHLACSEGRHNDGVQVETLTKHPEEVTSH